MYYILLMYCNYLYETIQPVTIQKIRSNAIKIHILFIQELQDTNWPDRRWINNNSTTAPSIISWNNYEPSSR